MKLSSWVSDSYEDLKFQDLIRFFKLGFEPMSKILGKQS